MQIRLQAAFLSLLLASCGSAGKTSEQALENMRRHIEQLEGQAEHADPVVVVQHILIGFEGSVPGKPVTRTRAEVEQLAADIWARVEAGDDFDTLVKQHTDDAYPGIYTMKLDQSKVRRPEFGRGEMVPVFGNVGWRLKVGEAGVGGYDPIKSKFGWHIVKRIE